MTRDPYFWQGLDRLVREHSITIDRPKESRHPRWTDKVYPLDYGYLTGIAGGDGEALDVFVGEGGAASVTGIICSVDLLKEDVEVKLLMGCSEAEMMLARGFMDEGDLHPILIRRGDTSQSPGK